PAPTRRHPLSLHDALPISKPCAPTPGAGSPTTPKATAKPSLYRAHLLRTRGGCSYGFGGGIGYVVGAPPSVRTGRARCEPGGVGDRKSTRLNSSHVKISYA